MGNQLHCMHRVDSDSLHRLGGWQQKESRAAGERR